MLTAIQEIKLGIESGSSSKAAKGVALSSFPWEDTGDLNQVKVVNSEGVSLDT